MSGADKVIDRITNNQYTNNVKKLEIMGNFDV